MRTAVGRSTSPMNSTEREKSLSDALCRCWFLLLFVLTGFSACATALTRPFWNDEICTVGVAGLKSLRAIRNALAHGADAQPPLFYWISGWCARLPVPEEFGLRLPAIAGFLALMAAVFIFVRRARGPLAALVSVAILLSS